jgi:hypothetical protein
LNPHWVSVTPRVLALLLLAVEVPMNNVETQVRKPQLSRERKGDFLDCGYCRFPTMIARSFSFAAAAAAVVSIVVDDDS